MSYSITLTPELQKAMRSYGLSLEDQGLRNFAGMYARIPIRVSPERRARLDWDDAVAWLEAREAARIEWPWPERG